MRKLPIFSSFHKIAYYFSFNGNSYCAFSFRIVIALFGFLVILSTSYELYIKLKKDENPSLKNNLTTSDTNNGVGLNGIKTISTGDLEIKE